MNRDKQIALMKVAAERQDSPLKAWIALDSVQQVIRLDPDEIARAKNGAVPASDCGGTMFLACA